MKQLTFAKASNYNYTFHWDGHSFTHSINCCYSQIWSSSLKQMQSSCECCCFWWEIQVDWFVLESLQSIKLMKMMRQDSFFLLNLFCIRVAIKQTNYNIKTRRFDSPFNKYQEVLPTCNIVCGLLFKTWEKIFSFFHVNLKKFSNAFK